MSGFGGPGNQRINTKPTPPERGSFPLDHDGECKAVMTSYLACMKKVRGVNEGECRDIARSYLACRMDNNLMARDEFKNLGFQETTTGAPSSTATSVANGDAGNDTTAQPEQGKKGELLW